jgi:hypothetical protein
MRKTLFLVLIIVFLLAGCSGYPGTEQKPNTQTVLLKTASPGFADDIGDSFPTPKPGGLQGNNNMQGPGGTLPAGSGMDQMFVTPPAGGMQPPGGNFQGGYRGPMGTPPAAAGYEGLTK